MWNAISDVLKEFGIWGGLFVIFFLGMHFWIYRLYENRFSERQQEIDRLAKENHEYRERFQKLIDDTISNRGG